MGRLWATFVQRSETGRCAVSCIIDKAQNEAGVISIGEFLRDNREASVVVVTPIYAYGEVYRELADKIDVPMISLEEVIQSLVQG